MNLNRKPKRYASKALLKMIFGVKSEILLIYVILGILLAFLVIATIGISMTGNSKQQFCQENGWQEHMTLQSETTTNYCHTEGKLSQPFVCTSDLARQRCVFLEALP